MVPSASIVSPGYPTSGLSGRSPYKRRKDGQVSHVDYLGSLHKDSAEIDWKDKIYSPPHFEERLDDRGKGGAALWQDERSQQM
jgi:hypothetical protein